MGTVISEEGARVKFTKGRRLILQGRKRGKNICYLEGQSLLGKTCYSSKMEKKTTKKRVSFSGIDEIWEFESREDLLGF